MEVRLDQTAWRKSSHSGQTGNCVEVADGRQGTVAVRDSKAPDGPTLVLTPIAWRTLGSRIKNGELA